MNVHLGNYFSIDRHLVISTVLLFQIILQRMTLTYIHHFMCVEIYMLNKFPKGVHWVKEDMHA